MNADFVVFGGGPAGVAAAIGLVRGNARVLLFERRRSPDFKPGEIIEASVQQPLRELGLWDSFLELGSLRCAGTLSAWGGPEPIEASSIRNPWGAGFLVNRDRLELSMIEAAVREGVRVVHAPDALEFEISNHRRILTWSVGGNAYRTQPAMFVQATGRARGVAGSATRTRHDRLVALLYYGSILDESRLDTRLYIEAVSDGWWYSAPLPGGVAVSVFMTDERTVPRGRAKRDFFFIQRLNETQFIRQRCGSEVVGLTLRVAPASTTIRTELKGEDWVAIGDAAATYDPLAGFGVVAALSKGAAVARLLLGEVSVSAAADAYVETELESFRDYLAMRAKIYGRERRWQDNAFWKERHVRN